MAREKIKMISSTSRTAFSGALAIVGISTAAYANCSCICVNGQNQAVCDYNTERAPICGPRYCANVQVQMPEPLIPQIPAVGQGSCHSALVTLPSGNMAWRQICD
jgi:hypothetical protein